MHRIAKAVLLTLVVALGATEPAAASAPTAQSVIVKYRSDASSAAASALGQRLGLGAQTGSILHSTANVFTVAGDPAAVAARLERSPLVAYAEPNLILKADAIPNDPMFGQLYGLNNTGQTGGTPDADIDAPEGWDAAGLGSFPLTGGVKVGVVDTGIQAAHPDLAGKLANCAQSIGLIPGVTSGSIRVGSCADDNGHGTHVSGTITANANNGIGVTGVSFNSQLAMCRALSGPAGIGTTADVANCVKWDYDQGAKVISMSLGGGDSTTLKSAVDYAWKGGAANGAVIVAAAGNDGDATLNYPAAYPNVVSVAATDNRDQRASFSNANSDVEVAAPGVDITSTWNDGTYNTISGTSMATPHVAGVTALIRSRYPTATAAQIVAKLDGAVDDLGPAGRDTSFGFGRVNLLQAATE